MQGNQLNGMRVAIIVDEDFEQVEMTEPRKALDQAGARTTLISPKPGEVTGMNHDVKADKFPVDMTLEEANPNDFDALMLPGGALNADSLRINPKPQNFAQQMNSSGRPIAIICHAPWLLVSARLVKGRTLNSYHTIQDDILNVRCTWLARKIVRVNNSLTRRSPKNLRTSTPP